MIVAEKEITIKLPKELKINEEKDIVIPYPMSDIDGSNCNIQIKITLKHNSFNKNKFQKAICSVRLESLSDEIRLGLAGTDVYLPDGHPAHNQKLPFLVIISNSKKISLIDFQNQLVKGYLTDVLKSITPITRDTSPLKKLMEVFNNDKWPENQNMSTTLIEEIKITTTLNNHPEEHQFIPSFGEGIWNSFLAASPFAIEWTVIKPGRPLWENKVLNWITNTKSKTTSFWIFWRTALECFIEMDSSGDDFKTRRLTRAIISDLSTAMEEGWHTTQTKSKTDRKEQYNKENAFKDSNGIGGINGSTLREQLHSLHLTRTRVLHRGEYFYQISQPGQNRNDAMSSAPSGEINENILLDFLEATYNALTWLESNQNTL